MAKINEEKLAFLLAFGSRVKKYRLERNMTLEELANKIGYTSENARSSVQKIEAGKSDPPASKISMLAKALEVSVALLMGWTNETTENNLKIDEKNNYELLEKCHDKTTLKAVSLFIQLDQLDQGNILGRMEIMLEDSKYSIQKGLKDV